MSERSGGRFRGRQVLAPLGALLAASLAAGCLPTAVTRESDHVASLYWIAMAMSAVVLAAVWLPLAFVVLRYRRRRQHDALPPQTRGSRTLELVWTAGPLLTIVVLFALTLGVLNALGESDAAAEQPANDAVELYVTGFRWGWQMEYPQAGVVLSGVLEAGPVAVLPVDRPITITLTATDVNHAFYVPQFLYKRDAVPGRENRFTLTITDPGTYAGQCAEFCGLFHHAMPFTIEAVDDIAFREWLTRAAASPSPAGPPSPAGSPSPSVAP